MKSSIIPLGLTTTLLLILISFSPPTSAQPLPRTVRPPLLLSDSPPPFRSFPIPLLTPLLPQVLATFIGTCGSENGAVCSGLKGQLTFQDGSGITGSGTFSFSIPSSSSSESSSESGESGESSESGDGVSPSPFSGVMNGTLNIKEGEPFIVSFSSLPDASGLQADLPFNHVFYSGSAVASSITSPSFQSFSAIVSSSLNIVSGPSFSQGAAAISINLWPTE